jgi:N,N'-diacetyllegionaminate synthase
MVKIIAEAGINHNGSLKLAFKLIDAAKNCGADYVKFQTAVPDEVVLPSANKASYQKKNIKDKEKQIDMIRKLHFSLDKFHEIKNYCKKKKIKFLSSPFDNISLNFLIKMRVEMLKIPSGEITNFLLLQKASEYKKKILLSTGMATDKEIFNAILILRKKLKKKNIVLLQCNTAYPTPFSDANLSMINEYKKKFKLKVGYSDHTPGIEASLAAVALGSEYIEKHLTLDKKMKGPDHSSSLNPAEFKNMFLYIKKIQKALIKKKNQPKVKKKI